MEATSARFRHLQLSADATTAAWADFRSCLAALEQLGDALRVIGNDSAAFEQAAAGDVRKSVPLQHRVLGLAASLHAAVDDARAAADVCAAQDAALRDNVADFLYMAVDTQLASRKPEDTRFVEPRPPLPLLDLVNPALGDVVNNVPDEAAPQATLAGLAFFG